MFFNIIYIKLEHDINDDILKGMTEIRIVFHLLSNLHLQLRNFLLHMVLTNWDSLKKDNLEIVKLIISFQAYRWQFYQLQAIALSLEH